MKKNTKLALVGGLLAVALILGIGLINSGAVTLGDPPYLFIFK